jgi:hypothetical protein
MPELVPINAGTDVIIDTTKVTAGFFTGNLGTLASMNLVTASKSSTQKGYYYDMQYSSEDQFSVSFGHIGGSGSHAGSETKAIYMQFKNLLISPDDIASTSSNGFKFEGTHATSGSISTFPASGDAATYKFDNVSDYEDFMYFIVMDRARMKDRINRKNWTLKLSGSVGADASSSLLSLTDDSSTVTGESTIAGTRYNIVSGSDGTIVAASSSKYYGWIYPSMGVIALRGQLLSASISGQSGSLASGSLFGAGDLNPESGLAPTLVNDGTSGSAGESPNAIKFAQSIALCEQKFRSEEDQTSKSYFIRAFANDMNFSNNPTFTSGSDARLRFSEMIGYPSTFISTVGLYQPGETGNPELVAIGRLSGPVEKNYGTEATIKVKLTY